MKAIALGVVISLMFTVVGTVLNPLSPNQIANPEQIAPTAVWISLVFSLLAYIGYAMYGVVYNSIALNNDVDLRPLEGLIGGALVGGIVGLLNTGLAALYFAVSGGTTFLQAVFAQIGLQTGMAAMVTTVGLLFSIFLTAALGALGAAVGAGLNEYTQHEPSLPQFG
jgi:uncharacterized membrane protein